MNVVLSSLIAELIRPLQRELANQQPSEDDAHDALIRALTSESDPGEGRVPVRRRRELSSHVGARPLRAA